MLKITVTVESTNHISEIVFTNTQDCHGGDPSNDGRDVRTFGPGMVEAIARQLDKLTA